MLTIDVLPLEHGRFRALLDGTEVCVSRTPLLSAARVLLDRGTDPDTPLAMKHADSTIISMRTTVGVAAGLTVKERESGPRFERWSAFPGTQVRPPAAESDAAATGQPKNANGR